MAAIIATLLPAVVCRLLLGSDIASLTGARVDFGPVDFTTLQSRASPNRARLSDRQLQ